MQWNKQRLLNEKPVQLPSFKSFFSSHTRSSRRVPVQPANHLQLCPLNLLPAQQAANSIDKYSHRKGLVIILMRCRSIHEYSSSQLPMNICTRPISCHILNSNLLTRAHVFLNFSALGPKRNKVSACNTKGRSVLCMSLAPAYDA